MADLSSASLEALYDELKRRAVANGLSVEELVAQAKENWQNADTAADDQGHEGG